MAWLAALGGVLLYGLFGAGIGAFAIPVSVCAVVWRQLPRHLGVRLLAIAVSSCTMIYFLSMWDDMRPTTAVRIDRDNVRQVLLALMVCHADGSYPTRLTELVERGYLHRSGLVPPGGFGELDRMSEGPLMTLFKRNQVFVVPGSGGDSSLMGLGDQYLYFPPSGGDENPHKVVIMTGPNVLYENQMNVGYLDGTVRTYRFDEWSNDPVIVGLIKGYARKHSS